VRHFKLFAEGIREYPEIGSGLAERSGRLVQPDELQVGDHLYVGCGLVVVPPAGGTVRRLASSIYPVDYIPGFEMNPGTPFRAEVGPGSTVDRVLAFRRLGTVS